MKNLLIGLLAGAWGAAVLVVWFACNSEDAFDKMVESWRTI